MLILKNSKVNIHVTAPKSGFDFHGNVFIPRVFFCDLFILLKKSKIYPC